MIPAEVAELMLASLPGWCTTEKGRRLREISRGASLCVELGVFGGRSLLPMALALSEQGYGCAHGIDPYSASAMLEGDNDPGDDEWWAAVNYESAAASAENAAAALGVKPFVRMVRERSADAFSRFEDGSIDVLHQDGNHSEEVSSHDVALWSPKMRPGGRWVLNDAGWPRMQPARRLLEDNGYMLLEDHGSWKVYAAPEPRRMFFGQAWQDRFVNAVIGVEEGGTFLDVGCGDPVVRSNTFALERAGWKGLLVDRLESLRGRIAAYRTSPYLSADACKVDWAGELARASLPLSLDYLSFDIDEDSLEVLRQFPLDRVRFRVMTVEHDAYRFGDEVRQEMRAIFVRHGYSLLCPDVQYEGLPFEDWWVDPARVDMAAAERLRTRKSADYRAVLGVLR